MLPTCGRAPKARSAFLLELQWAVTVVAARTPLRRSCRSMFEAEADRWLSWIHSLATAQLLLCIDPRKQRGPSSSSIADATQAKRQLSQQPVDSGTGLEQIAHRSPDSSSPDESLTINRTRRVTSTSLFHNIASQDVPVSGTRPRTVRRNSV